MVVQRQALALHVRLASGQAPNPGWRDDWKGLLLASDKDLLGSQGPGRRASGPKLTPQPKEQLIDEDRSCGTCTTGSLLLFGQMRNCPSIIQIALGVVSCRGSAGS